MRNPDILLWFIRKKHRNQKYDLFLCCSLRHFGGSHSLPQNPLNGNLAHIQTDRHIHKLCTKNTCAKLWGGQAWHRVPALCVFICRIKVTNQSDGRQKKKKKMGKQTTSTRDKLQRSHLREVVCVVRHSQRFPQPNSCAPTSFEVS